jgi:hypothetical protein
MRPGAIFVGAAVLMALAGCGGGASQPDVCANAGALRNTTFVFVHAPRSGESVSSGFHVSLLEHLRGECDLAPPRQGRALLASGFTQGGGSEPGPFRFTVAYSVGARQIGQLDVDEPTVTEEGFPAVRNIVPLVLER